MNTADTRSIPSGSKSCSKCAGTGYTGHFLADGVCFKCGGKGYVLTYTANKAIEIEERRAKVVACREAVERAKPGGSRRSAEANLKIAEKALAFWEAS